MKNITEQLKETIVEELYGIENNEGCHEDYIEDYETEVDFYLSNVKSDTYEVYVKEYCSNNHDISISNELAFEIIDELIGKIKDNN
ncbi:hypothetical protein OKR33_17010 [Clostridioides difficile]|uniref:hypothetical protein n=1 Tax=Clostridioides difficile TaxID=1496 RepID=UPI00093BAA46|nr:hypothetical protein [Clostridioides difficile]MBH7002524.1 hypothetical protein [Clostridioides difficile]MBH7225070.1 hypothetical protein [Clostridioides difficile]MCR1411494.1 hypothetical protein [Clostridioides difficile]MCW0758742.1 hypothetical protein [Clostridioides difficile]MCW0777544.1 hypothetical protein [Clostridioides difficile]